MRIVWAGCIGCWEWYPWKLLPGHVLQQSSHLIMCNLPTDEIHQVQNLGERLKIEGGALKVLHFYFFTNPNSPYSHLTIRWHIMVSLLNFGGSARLFCWLVFVIKDANTCILIGLRSSLFFIHCCLGYCWWMFIWRCLGTVVQDLLAKAYLITLVDSLNFPKT